MAFITGDEGFLGRHFREQLLRKGFKVGGCDIKSGTDCREFFNARTWPELQLVIHCAAIVGGRENIEKNPLAIAENFELDSAFFRWAVKAKPGRVIYLSSSAIYPVRLQTLWQQERLIETHVNIRDYRMDRPDANYGWAKLIGEMLATQLREQTNTKVTIVRPFSGYGADQDETYPFPAFIARAKRRDDPFQIWGNGTQTRDFIHVDDLVEAALTAAYADEPGPMNICSGYGTSFLELANKVCEIAGYSPTYQMIRDAPRGVEYRVGDPSIMIAFRRPRITLESAIEQALGM